MRSIKLSDHVKDWLRKEIIARAYCPENRIPSEYELMSKLGVSRSTVRKAISELVLEGWLYRVQGRGTFVSKPKFRQTLSRLTSFTEDMHMLGLIPKARLLSCQLEKPTQKIVKDLHISSDDDVIRIKRLRLANDEPVAINVSILPYRLVPGLEKIDLENGSLYEVLEKHYGHILYRAEQTLEPALLSKEQAALLGITPSTPVLRVEGITFLKNGTPIELLNTVYRGDRYKFHLTTTR